ncbi:hypothetical protein F4141_13210 [Candidatus Poribacteria bacterium]|nr:hypothetical protein [Candidatus Poribacteria bacterium]MYH81642.1 hypothetical protein [Candidatus Poribacteria bacterium]
MKNLPLDIDVREIVSIAENLRNEYNSNNLDWVESPFAWIKCLPSRTKGKIGEQLIERWCTEQNFDVKPSPDSEADRIISGLRVEIKSSTLWKSGIYKFQQLRDQAYDLVICLGISPYDVHCWILSKKVILDQWKSGGIRSQHTGRQGTDTAWLSVNPSTPQIWLTPQDGRPTNAIKILRQFTKARQ